MKKSVSVLISFQTSKNFHLIRLKLAFRCVTNANLQMKLWHFTTHLKPALIHLNSNFDTSETISLTYCNTSETSTNTSKYLIHLKQYLRCFITHLKTALIHLNSNFNTSETVSVTLCNTSETIFNTSWFKF